MPAHSCDINQLAEELGMPVRTIRTLMGAKKIPYLKPAHKILRFQPEKVKAALERFEIREVGAVRP